MNSPETKQISVLKMDLHAYRMALALAYETATEADKLLRACLDTGALRVTEHAELYRDVCKFLGVEAK